MLGAKKGTAQCAAPFGKGRNESERELGPKRDGVEILAQIGVGGMVPRVVPILLA